MKRQTKKNLNFLLFFCFLLSFVLLVIKISSVLNGKTYDNIKINKNSDKNSASTKLIELNGNFLRKYPDLLNCNNNKLEKKWSTTSVYDDSEQRDYLKIASRSNLNSRMVRGILVYFPADDSQKYLPEFKWMYQNWIQLNKHEPAKWRTDLIVFTEVKVSNILQNYNCSFKNIRKLETELPMCTLIKYVPIKKRNLTLFSSLDMSQQNYEYLLNDIDIFSDNEFNLLAFMSLIKENLSKHIFLDSVMIAFEGYSYFKSAGYDYLLRTDLDIFLTPLFAKWLPKHCNDFVVGGGDYSADFNMNRLKRVAIDLKLEFAGQWNLGSTWYSTAQQFRLVSYLTLFGMIYLTREEFAVAQIEEKVGTMLWPDWHYDAVLFYGQNLILNHLIKTKQLNVPRLYELIDYSSESGLLINSKLHIHVYNTNGLFSKFAFKRGDYDNMTVSARNETQIRNYCLKIALESRKASDVLLAQFLKEIKRKV